MEGISIAAGLDCANAFARTRHLTGTQVRHD